jgi:hypothetical protein
MEGSFPARSPIIPFPSNVSSNVFTDCGFVTAKGRIDSGYATLLLRGKIESSFGMVAKRLASSSGRIKPALPV